MDGPETIQRYFDPARFIEVCRTRFDELRTQIVANLETKTSTSGRPVNSLGLPEWTTGATATSLRTIVERDDMGFSATFVGRRGIRGIDEGQSPGEIRAEYGSFDAFLRAIERWAQAKEGLYGLEEIDAYRVTANLWSRGTMLYREGGGTEIMLQLLQPAVDDIETQITDQLDAAAYDMLNQLFPDNGED